MTRIFPLLWLIILFLVAAFVASAEAATSRFEIKQMVMSEAAKSEVPISLALAVAKVESDFNARALSSAGARGVMQIMPATARDEFGISARKLWNPQTNIRLGVRFLEQLYEQYGGRWDMALSHYNGGTIKGNQPHKYTRKYVKSVQKWQRIYQEQANLWDGGDDYQAFDDEDDGFELAELREWQPRGRSHDDYDDEAEVDEDWGEARIIIVERERPNRRWGRPPPPRHERWGRPPPRPRPYFH